MSLPYWHVPGVVTLHEGDSLNILGEMESNSFDVIFADPPYRLSNDGSTCKSGSRASVNKADWDRSHGFQKDVAFNQLWLNACQRLLKPNGTIWVSGTSHVIHTIGFLMQKLGFKHINEIVWEKPNPPPNLSCRYFTHSTESILWAAKNHKSKHVFNYKAMREENGGKQMKTVWRMPAPPKSEKLHGKHPTQKPLKLLERLLSASTDHTARVLDPFNGSGTTGVAACSLGLEYVGIDTDRKFLGVSKKRISEVIE